MNIFGVFPILHASYTYHIEIQLLDTWVSLPEDLLEGGALEVKVGVKSIVIRHPGLEQEHHIAARDVDTVVAVHLRTVKVQSAQF